MHPPAINKYLISAHTIVSCTMWMGGRSGKVLACPEHPGRFYVRGKTGPNTSSSRKNRKIVSSGGLGWGQKVVGHMPWGALSGSLRVQGHERVFWGCCGGYRAPVVQCMQYMQILIAYLRIHANTYRYLQIPIYNTYCSNIPT